MSNERRRDLVFLPGAAGSSEFWSPVCSRLPEGWRTTLLSWPGAGTQPLDPAISSFEDLAAHVEQSLPDGCDVIAQSMGGIIAIALALKARSRLRRLVLVATSGGINVARLGARDWRAAYRSEYPDAAAWITEQQVDYTALLPTVTVPTLLIWGDQDPISPVNVGTRLAELLPASKLCVLPGGNHDLARERAEEVASLIEEHLR